MPEDLWLRIRLKEQGELRLGQDEKKRRIRGMEKEREKNDRGGNEK